jgi:ribosomal protein S18 acetylase RimI-like enzyme
MTDKENNNNDDQESRITLKKKKLREIFHNIASDVADLFHERTDYIEMRLPVSKITPEFEAELKEKVEHSILYADIREASEEQIELVKDVYDKAWRSSPMPIRDVKLDHFMKIFKDPTTEFLIAKIDNNYIGFILIDLEGKNNEIGVIAGLGVLPKYQHKGVGTILALAAWNFLKKKGIKEIRCEVYEDNRIPYGFIKSLGFEEHFRADHGLLMK